MSTQHHPLAAEFPEFKEEIHTIKMNNAHFSRLFDEYEVVDKKIVRLQGEGIPVADETIEDLKKERLLLKNELYVILRHASAS